jgi:ketosteroid isomerase-like protein
MDHDGFLRDMFAALDRDSVHGLFPYLTEDVEFRFAGYPKAQGRETFAKIWAEMSGAIRALEHRLHGVGRDGDVLFCRGDVSYHLTDGATVTVPFANWFRLRGDLISEYLIYVDASPVFGASPVPA